MSTGSKVRPPLPMAQQIYLQLGPPPFPLLPTLFNVGKIEEKEEEVVEGGGRGETLKKSKVDEAGDACFVPGVTPDYLSLGGRRRQRSVFFSFTISQISRQMGHERTRSYLHR